MEYAKKYWYVIAIAVVALIFLSRRQSGATLTQVSGGTDVAGLAQISASERDADENRKYGLIGTLLNYDLSTRQLKSNDSLARISLNQQLDLARISAEAQSSALTNQFQLASLQAQMAQQSQQAQLQAQQDYLRQQYGAQQRSDWIGAILGGLNTISPYVFSQQSSGGFNFPSTPPFNGGGFNFDFGDWF